MKWEKARFGDVIQFNPTHKLQKDAVYDCIEMEHIIPGNKFAYPAKQKNSKASGSKFQNGDTIFARITPCLENGKIAVVKDISTNIGLGSTEFFVFRHIDGVTSPKYIYYLALTEQVRETAIKSMQGASGRQRALREPIENLQIKLPLLPIQNTIASILSAYDDFIENNLQRIKLLEQAAKCEYEMLMKASKVKTMRLIDTCDLVMGQSPLSSTYNDIKEGLPFHQGVTNFGSRFVEHKTYCIKPTRIAQTGDILMSVRAPVGRLNFTSDKICIGRGVCAIKNKQGLQQLQYQILKSFFYFEDRIGNGSTFNATTKNELEKLELVYPVSSKKVYEVESRLQEYHNLMLNLFTQNAQLRQARDILLPKLMSGQIDVSKKQSVSKLIPFEAPVVSMVAEDAPIYETKKPKGGAKYYFRTLLAAYIVNNLWQERTFGHVKLMKLMYLSEHVAHIETVSNYHRDAAGPYDNQMMRSIDKQLKEKKWFEMYKKDGKYPKYKPMEKAADFMPEFTKYHSDKQTGIDSLIQQFRTASKEQIEMVATVYEAWRYLSTNNHTLTIDAILNEILNLWHESKERISKERWIKCYEWVLSKGWITM